MDVERLLEPVMQSSGKIVGVVDTHVHADHISGAREAQRLCRCPLYMSKTASVKFEIEPLDEGEVELSGLRLRIIDTPGHSPENLSIVVDDRVLLSGDCLLVGDVGRVDLRGRAEDLYTSLHSKLLALDDSVEVLPAHIGRQHFVSGESSSTIGIERRSNPALQMKSIEEFRTYMAEGWPPKPEHYELFIKVNSGQIPLSEAQAIVRKAEGELV